MIKSSTFKRKVKGTQNSLYLNYFSTFYSYLDLEITYICCICILEICSGVLTANLFTNPSSVRPH